MKTLTKRILKAVLASLVLSFYTGCGSTDGGSAQVSGSLYYGTGFYDPWYYGGYYYPPTVVVPPPPDRPPPPQVKPPVKPTPPIATPMPRPRPTPSIPSMPRGGGRR